VPEVVVKLHQLTVRRQLEQAAEVAEYTETVPLKALLLPEAVREGTIQVALIQAETEPSIPEAVEVAVVRVHTHLVAEQAAQAS
tara:strand:- start:32 stop:283 length:252 start_codon:yes stop_codon:yes gene_type:complete